MLELAWLYAYWHSFYLIFLRRFFKFFMHVITGQCELMRIICSSHSGGKRIKKIEKCLKLSRIVKLKDLVLSYHYDVEETVHNVTQLKGINADNYVQFKEVFTDCLERMRAYNYLLDIIETKRKTAFNSHDEQHGAMLMQLWSRMQPHCPLLDRVSDQWTDIGFQGTDPATDFRGMGILGLDQLLFFATDDMNRCRHVLCQSQHPTRGYSYAIVGINLTAMLYYLMKKRKLRSHFYNVPTSRISLDEYHQLYCYLFFEFDKYWAKKEPDSIMEFNRIREKFQRKFTIRLKLGRLPLDLSESFI